MLTRIQDNRLRMFKAVYSTLESNFTIFRFYTALALSFNELKGRILAIESKGRKKVLTNSGRTADKKEYRDELIKIMVILSGKLFVFARKTKNNDLMETADVAKNRLTKLRDVELKSKAKIIFDRLTDNLTLMADYNISQTNLDALKQCTYNFDNSIGGSISGKAGRSSAGKSAHALIIETIKFLSEEVDNLMKEYNKEDTLEFYNTYKSARIVLNPGLRHRKAVDS